MPSLVDRLGEIEAMMFLDRFFKPKPAVLAGKALYNAASAQARSPAFYAQLAAPDTLEGRFELYTLHVVLLLDRLKNDGSPFVAEARQCLFDAYVFGLDDALREIGVADTSVAKKMKKLAGAFYGRHKAYDTAFAALPDVAELNALVGRTLFDNAEDARAAPLAAYAAAARAALAQQDGLALVEGAAPAWPPITP
jgi:cytochrome b pre-mRNA-processing protein 3